MYGETPDPVTVITTGASSYPFRYTGQRYESDFGLYNYKARIYSPKLGRFYQTDPIGSADNLNLYAYVGNNPIDKIDPTGEDSEGIFGGGTGIEAGWNHNFAGTGLDQSLGQTAIADPAIDHPYDEEGNLDLAAWAPGRSQKNLLADEALGGHTWRDHVGKADSYLQHRDTTTDVKGASSYVSLDSATRIVNAILSVPASAKNIAAVADGEKQFGVLDGIFNTPTGYGYIKGYQVTMYGARVVIVHDPISPDGFIVLTSFPIPTNWTGQ